MTNRDGKPSLDGSVVTDARDEFGTSGSAEYPWP